MDCCSFLEFTPRSSTSLPGPGYVAFQLHWNSPKEGTSLSEKRPWTSCSDLADVSLISPGNLDGPVPQVLDSCLSPRSFLQSLFGVSESYSEVQRGFLFAGGRLYLVFWWLWQTLKGNVFVEQKDVKRTHLSQRPGLTLQLRQKQHRIFRSQSDFKR